MNVTRSRTEDDVDAAHEGWELEVAVNTIMSFFEVSPHVHFFYDASSNLRVFSTDLARPLLQLLHSKKTAHGKPVTVKRRELTENLCCFLR